MDLPVGTRIEDRYEVLSVLGRGAMAVVYAVRHLQLGTVHALKVLQIPTRVIRDRLLVEGQIQGALRHPNVVVVTDSVEVDGSPGLVLELIRGPTLDRLLRDVPLDLEQVRALGTQILLGVQAAHRGGHVHRDLKPGNVLVDVGEDGLVAKVSDFGLAKLVLPDDQGTGATRTGTTLGTPAYMAPEQLRDARSVDARADVFSLGALLYELVTGARAFPQDDVMSVFDAIRAGRFAPVTSLRPDAPPAMAEAIAAALEPDPARRVGSVDELLGRWTDGRGADTARVAWRGDQLASARAIGVAVAASRPGSASSTYGGSSHDAVPVAEARWESTVHPTRTAPPRVALLAAGATGVAFVATLALGLLLVLAGAAVWWTRPRPVPTVPARVVEAVVEADPDVIDGRWDRVRERRTAELGPPRSREAQCQDPTPCLALAAALLWEEDAHAWIWLELAGDQSRRDTHHRLATRTAELLRGSTDVADEGRWLDRSLDDVLAVSVLAQIPPLDPELRYRALADHVASHPESPGPRLLLARMEARMGHPAAARELLDGILAAEPDHAAAHAALAELLLDRGDLPGAALHAAAAGPGPRAARLRAGLARMASPSAEALPAPPEDPTEAIGWNVGLAEAAFGAGFEAEARDHLRTAFAAADPLDRWSAAWLQAEMAMVGDVARGPDPSQGLLPQAALDLRKLAGEGLPAIEAARLSDRADLLDGLRAVRDGDAALLREARRGLSDGVSGTRSAELLAAVEAARGGVVPETVGVGACPYRVVALRALDQAGSERAPDLWRALAAGEGACGAFGVDRAARAEAWVRWAVARHRAGADDDARRGLREAGALTEGIEPAWVGLAGELESELLGL